MKKLITILSVIAVLIIITLIVSPYFKDKKIEPIRTTGIVEGTEVNLASKIYGKISELCCKEGDTLPTGSIVIRLESDDLKAAVEQANASVQRAIADILTSEANVEIAKARMDEAKRQIDRATALHKESFVSQESLDVALTNFNLASATYKASLSQLASAKARLKEAKAMLSFQKARFNDTLITSPISGRVVFKALEKGEFVSPGITILTIVDMDNLWVRIDLEESLVGHIRLESEVFISIDAIPEKKIKGKISEIGRYAEFATQRDVKRGRQDIKTFHVKISIEDPEQKLKPGMTVNVEIPRKS